MKSLSRILAGTSLALALLGSVDVNTLAACSTTTTTTTTKSGSDC